MTEQHLHFNPPAFRERLRRNQEIVDSLKARQDRKRGPGARLADWMTVVFGSIPFLIANVVWFGIWIAVNVKVIPGLKPFDPFPFGFLTMVVSLEAIVLAIFVLISQNRAARTADLREEVDLQVDMLAERELTKLLAIVSALAEKQGIALVHDEELQTMLQPMPMGEIEAALEEQVVGKPHVPPPPPDAAEEGATGRE